MWTFYWTAAGTLAGEVQQQSSSKTAAEQILLK
jgi:hypothetical protein